MKPSLLLAILLVASLTACRTVDQEQLRLVHDEIATLGSEARCAGSRSATQIARINSNVAAVQARVDQLVR